MASRDRVGQHRSGDQDSEDGEGKSHKPPERQGIWKQPVQVRARKAGLQEE